MLNVYNLVERWGWIEIDWNMLQILYCDCVSAPSYSKRVEAENKLALFITCLPIYLRGWSDDVIHECPPIELLRFLLSPEYSLVNASIQTRSDAQIHNLLKDRVWNDSARGLTWAWFKKIEGDERWPEPVRWLPAVARWATSTTGNKWLDCYYDPDEDGPLLEFIEQWGMEGWFTWDDLPDLRADWQQDRPVVGALERIVTWYMKDTTNLAKLARFVVVREGADELIW